MSTSSTFECGWLLAPALLLQACSADVADVADEGAVATAHEAVVYGNNDLTEFAAVADPRLKALADSTGALFRGETVICASGTCDLSLVQPFNQAETPTANSDNASGPYSRLLCPGERFKDQLYGAACSAFLVGPDLFATAGHCLCELGGACGCNGRKLVFGFKADASGQNTQWHLPEADVYTCTGTPLARYQNGEDWAFFRVDRAVNGHTPMIVQRTGTLLSGELAAVGYANGLPLKVARSGQLKQDSPNEPWTFSSNVDSSLGTSGGPVIDIPTGVVNGIHVTSPYWQYLDGIDGAGNQCAKLNVCSTSTGCNPSFAFSVWSGDTRMTYATAQGAIPLHPALIATATLL